MAYFELSTSNDESAISWLDPRAEIGIILYKQQSELGRIGAHASRGRRESRVVRLGARGVAS